MSQKRFSHIVESLTSGHDQCREICPLIRDIRCLEIEHYFRHFYHFDLL